MSNQHFNGGTLHQQNLFEKAMEFWNRGKELPLHLMAEMAAEGMDVVGLELKHMETI
jgi:hypothetical protein